MNALNPSYRNFGTDSMDPDLYQNSGTPGVISTPRKMKKTIWTDSFIGLSFVSLIALVYFFFFKEENLKMVLFVTVNFVLCYVSASMQNAYNTNMETDKEQAG